MEKQKHQTAFEKTNTGSTIPSFRPSLKLSHELRVQNYFYKSVSSLKSIFSSLRTKLVCFDADRFRAMKSERKKKVNRNDTLHCKFTNELSSIAIQVVVESVVAKTHNQARRNNYKLGWDQRRRQNIF
mgnify:CR=1 FL=1